MNCATKTRRAYSSKPQRQGLGQRSERGAPVSKHLRKDTATERGREIAKQLQTEHSIHNLDGTIGRKNSYGGESKVHDKNR
jgi:hypothetical protein